MALRTKVKSRLFLSGQPLFLTVWVAGAFLGAFTAAAASTSYFLMMRIAPGSNVSIVGLAVTVLLPFLLSAFAVSKDKCYWIYPICFIKIFLFCFCGYGIHAAFGSAGWLVQILFQFSDLCTMPVLCWFLIRHLNNSRNRKRDFYICLGIYAVVCWLDIAFVSPFLAKIT